MYTVRESSPIKGRGYLNKEGVLLNLSFDLGGGTPNFVTRVRGVVRNLSLGGLLRILSLLNRN